MTQDAITQALQDFDGRHVAPLRAVLATELDTRRLIERCPGRDEIGASWLLKALAETGRLSPAEMAGFLTRLPLLSEPDAILHLLQTAQHAPQKTARALRDDLVPLYRHPRGLVRVWAFDAYCRGAEMPQEAEDIAARIRTGAKDRFAAMRARSRALAKEFGVAL